MQMYRAICEFRALRQLDSTVLRVQFLCSCWKDSCQLTSYRRDSFCKISPTFVAASHSASYVNSHSNERIKEYL